MSVGTLLFCFLAAAILMHAGAARVRRQDGATVADAKTELPVTTLKTPPRFSGLAPFRCPFVDGLFADPVTCRKFYTCTANEAFQQSCPPGLFFDDVKKFCTFRNEAICGPVSYHTSTATPIDESLRSKKCDPGQCQLPDCFCSSDGTQIPGGLDPKEVPQIVTVTLTGGINHLNFHFFEQLFSANRTNPNGCRVAGTFFVAHDYTNYQYVQRLYADGNEIGVNSISARKPEEYWTRGSYENWTMEMVGMREILRTFAGVAEDDVLGVRGPFTKCGGNEQFDMMNDFGFVYDTTMATPPSRVPTWPFSLEYRMPFKCRSGNCPSYSYPGIWELPMNIMYARDDEGNNCAFLDQCVFLYADEDSLFEWLMENFERHYSTNRAPLGLHLQTSWFLDKERVKALNRFFDALLERDDVYFVTSAQMLQWVLQPTTLTEIGKFEPWACPVQRKAACNLPKTCALPHSGPDVASDIRYMQTCFTCPAQYPWVGNARGEDKNEPDVYLPEVPAADTGAAAAPAPAAATPTVETSA